MGEVYRAMMSLGYVSIILNSACCQPVYKNVLNFLDFASRINLSIRWRETDICREDFYDTLPLLKIRPWRNKTPYWAVLTIRCFSEWCMLFILNKKFRRLFAQRRLVWYELRCFPILGKVHRGLLKCLYREDKLNFVRLFFFHFMDNALSLLLSS